MNKLNVLDKLQRFTILIGAVVFFMFALRQCIDNYLAYQTARSLEVIESKDFLLPEITVCLDQTMQQEALSKYGYTSPISYILGPWQCKYIKVLSHVFLDIAKVSKYTQSYLM